MDNRCVCSHGSTYRLPPPSLSISSGLPHARHNNVEMRSINNPTVASKCSRERKSHTSVTSNQKLGLIRLSGDSTLTVQTKSQASYANSLVMGTEEELGGNLGCSSSRRGNDEKWDRLLADG